MPIKPLWLGLAVTSLLTGALKAQNTNLIDIQFASGDYDGSIPSSPQVGEAVQGLSGSDTWNQILPESPAGWFTSGNDVLNPTALNLVNGSSSGVTLSIDQNGNNCAVGTLPTSTGTGAITAGTADPGTVNLFSAGTSMYRNKRAGLGTISDDYIYNFYLNGLSADIGDEFTVDIYTSSPEYFFLSGGVEEGNVTNVLTSSAASQSISAGEGVAYVQYSGIITGNEMTVKAFESIPGTIVFSSVINGIQLELVSNPVTSLFWSNAPEDGNWTNGANWAGGSAPLSNSLLNFSASSITTLNNNFTNASYSGLNFGTNASAYTINGSVMALGYDGITNSSTNTQTINTALASSNGFSVATTQGGGNVDINGPVSGEGGISLTGGGVVTLGGSNSYSGATTVGPGSSLVLSGLLSNSAVNLNGGNFLETAGGVFAGTSGLTQNGTGTSTLAGNNSFAGVLAVNSGELILSGNNTNRPVSLADNTQVLGGAILQLQANSNNTVSGISYALSAEVVGNSVESLDLENGSTLQLLSDSNVTFAGGNSLDLNSANTTINIFVNQLTPGNSNHTIGFAPEGFSVADTTINVTGGNDGYTLALGTLGAFTGFGVTLQPDGAALQVAGVTAWTGQAGPSYVTVNGSSPTTITGPVTGTSTLNQEGSGTLILTAANTYTGATTINAGSTLELTGSASLGSGYYVGNIFNNGLLINGSSASQTWSGVISGLGGLIQSGTGALTLAASNNYKGPTMISSGTLVLNAGASITGSTNINLGTKASQGTLDVSADSFYALTTNQTLSGYGSINGPSSLLTVDGNITPGSLDGTTRGLISINGNLALGPNSTMTLTINNTGTAGEDFDALSVTGNLAFNGTLDLDVTTPVAGVFELFGAASYTDGLEKVALTGSWNPGSFTDDGSGNWSYYADSYNLALDENTGKLIISFVPEPSATALLGLGAVALVIGYTCNRRREFVGSLPTGLRRS